VSKETLVFIFGIILTILPFVGIPLVWRQYGILAVGALLIIIGYALRRGSYLRQLDFGNGERGNDSFIETTEKLFEDTTVE
jgi:hypothetical protein